MKYFLINILCLLPFFSYAQQGYLKGDVSTENFPEVSFIWNEYNPNILHPNQFTLKENGKELAFRCENIPVSSIPQKNKTILFLWEDQPVRKGQFDFTGALLLYFLKENMANDKTTTFNIAVFNRKQWDEPALKSKLPKFTSDKDALQDFITLYEHDKTNFQNPNESDLFLALKEGLDLIGKEPKDNIKAIVVVTAGLFVPGTGISPVINQALQNKIPIYVIHYPSSKDESKSALQRLTDETYGQLIFSKGNDGKARTELLKCINELNSRHYGQDYKISFTSNLKRDGSLHPLALNSNGTEYNIMPYKTPNFSLIIWAKQHLILFLIALVIIIAAITLGIIFGIKFYRKWESKMQAKKQDEERQKARQLSEQENLRHKLNATQEEIRRQQRTAEQEKQQVLEQEQMERLTKLMHTKNLLPRLIVVNDKTTFNISEVVTGIGRSEDNDIVLSDQTVSRHHAQIVFTGRGFEIHDLSSNGTIVNGNYIESTDLRNADAIQLGQVIIKFYL